MVLSKINDSVSYTESKTIDEDDKGRDVSMYKMQLFKIKVIIALGNIKYTYINENILYTPVYLVINETDKEDWCGRPLYRKYTTRTCKLIPDEQDRIAYLISFCLKNYYIGYANKIALKCQHTKQLRGKYWLFGDDNFPRNCLACWLFLVEIQFK